MTDLEIMTGLLTKRNIIFKRGFYPFWDWNYGSHYDITKDENNNIITAIEKTPPHGIYLEIEGIGGTTEIRFAPNGQLVSMNGWTDE